MKTTPVTFAFVAALAACIPPTDANAPREPRSAAGPAPVRDLAPSGPQSFTPETKPKGRTRAITQRWATRVGVADHRATMVDADGVVYVGTREGIAAIDAKTGQRKTTMPGMRGKVVGVALDGERVVATSAGGEVMVASRAGAALLRAEIGAPAATPPTVVDVDGDGVAEIAVGDAKGRVVLFDGKTLKPRWSKNVGTDPRPSIGAALAAADVDGDGAIELIAGAESGALVALDGKTGGTKWEVTRTSALRAAPVLADVDADRKLEVVAGWADGDVAIVDGKSGKQIWSAHVEEDDGDPTGLLASPTPLAGASVGVLVVPTARWGIEDSVILLGAHDRAHRSQQGRVVTSPVVGIIDPEENLPEAIVGTQRGDVVSISARGTSSLLYHLDRGAIEASPMFTDIEKDGTQELLVLTGDGHLVALALHVASPPTVRRARGSAGNDGVLPAVDLHWKLP